MLLFLSKKQSFPYLDELSDEAQSTQSVNTIYKKDDKIIGHNT
jgi:shikimate dehydrogenase